MTDSGSDAGSASGRSYQPIDCSLHDRLETLATLRKTVRIAIYDNSSELVWLEDRIVDITTIEGAEYMVLASGRKVRLDDVDSVDGVAFR